MAVSPLTYVKNVGKSFGYVAIETLGATSPALKDLISENKDTVNDLYHQIKDFTSSPMEKIRGNQKIMSYSNDIKTGMQNLVSDIKTGTLYNQARADDAMNAIMGIDFDFDNLFDEDFDFDTDLNSSSVTASTVAESSNKEILAMDVVGSRISTAVGAATAKSAEYIVGANAESTRAILDQNSKIFNALSTGMVGINQTLGSIATLSQPLTEHMQNSSVFFTKSTENQLKIIELLEKIEKNTTRPEPTKSSGGRKSLGFEDYLTSSGVIDIGKMLTVGKSNAKNALDNSMLGMMLSMNDMLGEGSLLKMFAANPIGTALPFILEGAILTPTLKKSLDNLSKALNAASVKMLRDINKNRNSSGIMSFIADLLGIDKGSGYIKGDTSKYEKGAVQFDGYTRQAIVKVIPEYLSMILTAVSGGQQRMYDYEAGKFVTRTDITNDIKKEFNRSVDRAGSDIKLAATEGMKDRKHIKNIDSLIDKYVANAIKHDRIIDLETHITLDDKTAKYYGFKNQEELGQFIAILNDIKKGDSWYSIELLNQNINATRIRNSNSSYDQMSARMYLYDNSYESHIRRAINNMNTGRESETAGNKEKGGSKNDEAAAPPSVEDGWQAFQKYYGKDASKKWAEAKANISESSTKYDKLNKTTITRELKRIGATQKEIDKWVEKFESASSDKEKDKFEQDYEKRLKNEEKRSGKALENAKSFFERIQNFISAPMDAVADLINKGSKAIYNIMYGKPGEEDDKSILGHIFVNIKDMFSSFKNWAKDTIFDPIKKEIEDRGGIRQIFMDFFGIEDDRFKDFRDRFRKRAGEITHNVGANLRSAGRWAWENSPAVQIARRVRGEGSGLYGGASEGEAPKYEDGWKAFQQYYTKANGFEPGTASRKYQEAKRKANRKRTTNYGEQVFDEAKKGASALWRALFPETEKDVDEEVNKVGEFTKDAVKEFKIDPSGAITGALIGTGVSILTGGVVGPFLAASIGGAAGLTIKSKSVQKALFGDDVMAEDENGNQVATGEKTGGLLNAQISTFLNRDLKKVAGYGITGGVLSLLPFIPGGPVTGLILGSAIGFANREGQLSNMIFGEKGEDGKREGGYISKEFQEKVKKLAPRAAIGAIAGAIAGPFGFVPNIILGAAVGFASETETFKRYIFGEETDEDELDAEGKPTGRKVRSGGITGWIRRDVINPVREAISPIAVEIKNRGLDIIRWTIRSISRAFERTVGSPLFEKINEHFIKPLANTVVPSIARMMGRVISLPFRAIGGIGRGLRQHQIRSGRANDMSALARLNYRNEHGLGNDEFTDFDTVMSGLSDQELGEWSRRFADVRKSGDEEQMNAFTSEFSSKFKLQNVNLSGGNIDKYMDTLRAESKNRKNGAAKLSPDDIRNQLIQSHSTRIENMLGAIANRILRHDAFDVVLEHPITGNTNNEQQNGNAPTVVNSNALGTRRSLGNVIRSAFNPFVGMDMESVQQALAYYQDQLDGNISALMNYPSGVGGRIRKYPLEDGTLRDDIVEVTDKFGYTAVVQKVNGSWMPYKFGTQLKNSLAGTRIGQTINAISSGVQKFTQKVRNIGTSMDLALLGMDKVAVYAALNAYVKQNINGETLTDDEQLARNRVNTFDDRYPGEHVVTVSDGRKVSGLIRFDTEKGEWVAVSLGWRAKRTANRIGTAIKNVATRISDSIRSARETIRHINPFCDFDSSEVPDIIDSLNMMEFEGGSDSTGKIEQVPGLKHYYQVVSGKGITVTVTARNGKWVYVSNRELEAAKAKINNRYGIGGMIRNVARRVVNNMFNNNNAIQDTNDYGSGSRLRSFIGGGSIALGYDFLSGEAISGKKDSKGNIIVDDAAKGNREAARKRNNILGKLDELLDNVKGIFGKVKSPEEQEEEEEKKKGFFESLLCGEDGLLGNFMSWFGGTALGNWMSKFSLKTIIPKVLPWIGTALLTSAFGAALTGRLDGIWNKLGLGGNAEEENKTTGENGEEIVYDEETKTYKNAKTGENYYGQVDNRVGDQATLSTMAKTSLVRGVAGSIAFGVGGVGRGTAGLVFTTLKKSIDKLFARLAKNPKAVERLGPILDNLDRIGTQLSERISKRLGENTLKNAAAVAKKAALILWIAMAVSDFITGYEDARTTFGILDEPSVPQRLVSGLIRLIKNQIPILDLINDSAILDIFCDVIGPFFGMKGTELQKQREEADATVAAFNDEWGTNLTKEQYIKQEMRDLTFTERSKEVFRDTGSDIAQMYRSVRDNGLKATVSNMFGDAVSSFTEGYKAQGGGIAGLFAGFGDAFSKLLPGIFGDIAKAKGEIGALSAKGDIVGMWKVSLPQFSGGAGVVNEHGVEQVAPSIFSKIIGQIPLLISKIIATPGALISKLLGGEKANEATNGIISGVGQNTVDIFNNIKQLESFVIKGDIKGLLQSKYALAEGEDVSGIDKIFSVIYDIAKVLKVPITAVTGVGRWIGDTFTTTIDRIKNTINTIKTQFAYGDQLLHNPDTNFAAFFNTRGLEDEEGNPISGMARGLVVGSRLAVFPVALMRVAGNKISGWFENIKTAISSEFNEISESQTHLKEMALAGNVSGVIEYGATGKRQQNSTPIDGFARGIAYLSTNIWTIVGAASKVGHWIGDTVDGIKAKFSAMQSNLDSSKQTLAGYAEKGDTSNIWNYDIEEATAKTDNPAGGFTKFLLWFSKVGYGFKGALVNASNAIHTVIDPIGEYFKTIGGQVNTADTSLSKFAEDGELSKIMKYDVSKISGSSSKEKVGGIAKLIIGVKQFGYGFKAIFTNISNFFSKVGDKISEVWDAIQKHELLKRIFDGIFGDKIESSINNAEATANTAGANAVYKGAQNWLVENGGSSFVSQLDPSVAGKRFGSTTIGDKGCAPSVVSMLTGAPITATASYATRRGYANKYGTSADYFGSVLGAAGIPSEYVYTGAGSAQDYLASQIASGHPTVLLGQDPYNTSKAYSPFGPGNHYVLATGMTNDGGVVIQDPESRTPNNIYDSSILNSVKLGIPTGGRSGLLRRALRRLRGGDSIELPAEFADYDTTHQHTSESLSVQSKANSKGGNTRDRGYSSSMDGYSGYTTSGNISSRGYSSSTDGYKAPSTSAVGIYQSQEGQWRDQAMTGYDAYKAGTSTGYGGVSGYSGSLDQDHQQIWTFLLRQGLTEEGAAGLMGCWECESSNHPNRIEGDYLQSFPGFANVTASSEALDNYCVNILFPAYKKVSINQSAYKGSDGHYYPGFGLAQWTGGRAYNLLQYAKSHNKDWRGLATQLNFAMTELKGSYSNVLSALKSGGTVAEMTEIACRKYEGNKRDDYLARRLEKANMIYSEFSGKSFSMPTDSVGSDYNYSSSAATSGSVTGSSGKSGGLTTFVQMFGNLVAAKFGKLGALLGLTSYGQDEGSEEGGTGYGNNGYGYGDNSNTSMGYEEGDWRNVVNVKAGKPNEQQLALVDKMKSIEGKLSYSMSGPRDPDQGSADCSSTVNWAYNKVLGTNIGGTTLALMKTGNMSTIDMSNLPETGGTGSGPDLSKLMPGDIVLLSRPTSSFTSGRPFRVGHVEMYMGDGKTIGHGSGNGPKVRNIESDKYIMARRFNDFIDFENASNTASPYNSPAPSAIANYQSQEGQWKDNEMAGYAEWKAAQSGSGSGLRYNIAQDGLNTINRKHKRSRSAFGGASGIVNLSKYSASRKAKYYRDLRGGAFGGDDDREVLIGLIKGIISLLSNVSANSDKINEVVGAVNNLASVTNNQQLSANINELAATGLGTDLQTETALKDMTKLLNQLASGA